MENLKSEKGQGTGSAIPKAKKQVPKDAKGKEVKLSNLEDLDPQSIRREAIMQW